MLTRLDKLIPMKTLITYLLIFIAGAAAAISYVHLREGNHDYAVMNKSHHEYRSGDQLNFARLYPGLNL